ncbi:MAG: hypothetical protein QXP12_04085 [Ignisphaera sp.]
MVGAETSRRFYTNIGVIMYTLSHRGFSRVRSIYRVIYRYFDVGGSYTIFYGYPRPRISSPIPTYFMDPPYNRGKVFRVGARLVQNPVVLYINLDSDCLKEDLITESVENVMNGDSLLYFTVPLTATEFLDAYRVSVYRIFEELKLLQNLQYPSYTIVVGVRKLFLSTDYTPWSIEPLVAIDTSADAVRVRNDTCIDTIPREITGFGKVLMDMLAKKLTYKLVSKGVLKQGQGVQILYEGDRG